MVRIWMLQLVWISALIWAVHGESCQHELWFQTSFSDVSASFSHLFRQNVSNAMECAQLCYSTENCKSAIYDEKPTKKEAGLCTLLPSGPECDQKIGRISQIGQYPGPFLIYCFSCLSHLEPNDKGSMSSEDTDEYMAHMENRTFTFQDDLDDNGADEKTRSSRRRKRSSRRVTLRVMTFNTWLSGFMVDDGLDKIAKHIKFNYPDIVFVQEMSDHVVNGLLSRLEDGRKWRACSRNSGNFDHILTPHKVVAEYEPVSTFWNTGCQVQLNTTEGKFVANLWNVHLYQHDYGPYKACFKSEGMKSVNELHKCEYNPSESARSRLRDMMNLGRHPPFMQLLGEVSSGTPLIVAGDFNSPSHLDWTDSTKPYHCQYSFDWPVSRFMEKLGFVDSYRVYRPDPYYHTGSTWSAIYKDSTTEFANGRYDPEPQDRIDYIFYKGERLQVTDAYTYQGSQTISNYPNYKYNDWPSDHASVVAIFSWVL